MCTIQCNMPIQCHFLPLPLDFSSATWVLAVCNNRTLKTGTEYPEDYLEPWISSKLHRFFFHESSRLLMLERSKEMTPNRFKSPAKNYSLCTLCSRKKLWFTKAMVLIICSSKLQVWLSPPPKGLLAICPFHHSYWMMLPMGLLPFIFQSVRVLWKCISLTDATLFIWVHPQKEQLWTGNS